jgi:rod shape-determining protein MreB and related proteins
MGFLGFLTETIGIDPGSQNLRIAKDGQLVFNEPSQISIDKVDNILSGLGDSIGTTSKDESIKPLNHVIANFQAFEMLLRGAIKKGSSTSFLPKSYIMYYSIPTSSTEIDLRAYRDSAVHAGAKEVYMVHQCFCSAVGMNILFELKNFILIDFGASKIEMIVFSNSVIISEGVIKLGTWKIFRLLKNYVRRKYKIELNDNEINDILIALKENKTKDVVKIQKTTINVEEIQDVLDNVFELVNDEFTETIERVSNHPDINQVIMNGIFFTGGGSTIDFLRDQIRVDDRIKRTLSRDPLLDNINGLKQIMADKKKFKNYLMF